MEALPLLVPIVGIAAVMTLLARLSRTAFVAWSLAFNGALGLFALLHPTTTTFFAGPLMASGFESVVFPLAAGVLFMVLAAWRRFARPGVLAFLACLPISMAAHYLGAWSA